MLTPLSSSFLLKLGTVALKKMKLASEGYAFIPKSFQAAKRYSSSSFTSST